MIVKVLGRDIDLSKVSQVSDWDGQGHYKITGVGIDQGIAENDYPREEFINLWKNSKIECKPVLMVLIPFRHLKEETAGLQMKSIVDWVTGQTNGEFHVICFAEKIETIDVKLLSLADVDSSTIEALQNKIMSRIEELTTEGNSNESEDNKV